MKKIWIYLVLTITLLYSKTYPVLPLSIDAVFGNGVNRWEEEQFVNGLGHTLRMRGHIELMYDAPFVLTVRITDYKRPDPHRGTQHRYRLKTRIKAYFWVKDRWDYDVYHGSVDYSLSLDARTSGTVDAYDDARRRLFQGLGERVAERLNENFTFMVDFERQQDRNSRVERGMSGHAVMMRGEMLDFENASVSSRRSTTADIGWYGDAYKTDMQRMVFLNGTRYGIAKGVGYRMVDRRYAMHMGLYGYDLFGREIHSGTVFVLKTAEGHYVKMQVDGFVRKNGTENAGLRLKWQFLE